MIHNKLTHKKHIMANGVYDFLIKTQLLVGGYVNNFK